MFKRYVTRLHKYDTLMSKYVCGQISNIYGYCISKISYSISKTFILLVRIVTHLT